MAEDRREATRPEISQAAAQQLLAELKQLRKRFHRCCLHAGSDAEHADEACASADAAIAAAEGRK